MVKAEGQQAIEIWVLSPYTLLGVMMGRRSNLLTPFSEVRVNGQQIALVVDKQIDSLPKVSVENLSEQRVKWGCFRKQPNIPKKW